MSITRRTGTRIAVAATAGVVALGGAAGGIAYASTTGTPHTAASPTPSSSSSAAKGHHKHGPLASARALAMGHALHGDVVVKGRAKAGSGGSYLTLQGQRGTITSVSSTALAVKSADGFTATYALGSKTTVHVLGTKSSASSLKSGQDVAVVAEKSGSTWSARTVVVPKPKSSAKRPAGGTGN